MYKVNISIDDVSPHPKSSTKVLEQCYSLIDIYPSIKFTLFVPIAYWRTMRQNVATLRPLLLSEYPLFCEKLKNLSKDNFEVAYHGYYHGIPHKSDNDEFKSMNYDDAISLYTKMLEEVKKVKLEDVFKRILRPPAWRMSPEAIIAAKDFGFEILALSPDEYPDGSLDYKGEDKKFKNVVYYNASPPYKPLKLHEKTEIVYHACEWDNNYLNKDKANELGEFLKNDNIEFCFIKELI